MDNAKASYARQVQAIATNLTALEHQLQDIVAVWNARLYGPGAANAFTDAELLALEALGGRAMKADDLYSFVILCDQFQAFLHNGTPAQRDYAANLNQLRVDI